MILTEIIQVEYSLKLSKLCHLAKNLNNLANWYIRQEFFNLNNFLTYYDLDFILKNKQAYQSLPSQTSQQILKYVNRNWKSYFNALREYRMDKRFISTDLLDIGVPSYRIHASGHAKPHDIIRFVNAIVPKKLIQYIPNMLTFLKNYLEMKKLM